MLTKRQCNRLLNNMQCDGGLNPIDAAIVVGDKLDYMSSCPHCQASPDNCRLSSDDSGITVDSIGDPVLQDLGDTLADVASYLGINIKAGHSIKVHAIDGYGDDDNIPSPWYFAHQHSNLCACTIKRQLDPLIPVPDGFRQSPWGVRDYMDPLDWVDAINLGTGRRYRFTVKT